MSRRTFRRRTSGTIRSLRNNVRFRPFLGALLLAAGLSSCVPAVPVDTVPRQYGDISLFLTPIKRTKAVPLAGRVSGITVPHHLLASDLIADTVALASGNAYDRIILLGPDHFFQGKEAVSVTTQAFDTVFGTLKPDPVVSEALATLPGVGTGSFFYREHGINAVTSFLKYHFPDAAFAAVTFKGTSSAEDLRRVAEAIKPLLTDRTLVVQSTDFSHYLTPADAALHDQQTLFAIASGNADSILKLDQPSHMDSLQAQWMQMTLQREAFGRTPQIVDNRNSQEYADEPLTETTSYVTQVYADETAKALDGDPYVFGGDFLAGRGVRDLIRDEKKRAAFVRRILSLTGGAPLIVNLEGVVADECSQADDPWKLCMGSSDTLPLLHDLNVVAVGVANNHALDLGEAAYDRSVAILEDAGIRVLRRNSTISFKNFLLSGFTDIDNSPTPAGDLLHGSDIAATSASGSRLPRFAFVHWGEEYARSTDMRQLALADAFEKAGFGLVIGAHSHTAVPLECRAARCVLPSLGNFLFDQSGEKVSGQLLKVTFFPQGTYALQAIPL